VSATVGWPRVPLAEAYWFQEGPGVRKWQFTTSGIKLLNVGNIEKDGTLNLSKTERCLDESEVAQKYSHFLVDAGDLVIASSGISFDDDGLLRTRGAFVEKRDLPLCLNTSTIRFKAIEDVSDLRFLRIWLNGREFRSQITKLVTGTAQQNFGPSHLKATEITLPSLAEQRRIAEVLDRAEALRAKRRAALAQLDTLTKSIFLALFGDPATNPRGWETLRLQDVLSMPLRNGLSPSNVGKVTAKVLTLSAITGSEFDDSAWKVSTFRSPPPLDQSVDENDFLICRGNGNVRLVGKGYFPTHRMPDVTFPDTMIAARVRADRLERVFLQHIWGWNAVRRQVESLARTTNGTFKVNQTMLEGITFIGPPLELQREFARRVGATDKMKAAQRASLAELDALFAVLQHRAFRGEL
jgi:type I restriction enzyme S subunit